MADSSQGHRTSDHKAPAADQEPEQLRSAIVSAIASIDADLAEILDGKHPSRDDARPSLSLPKPKILQAQRVKRLRELRTIFTKIKRRLDRRRG